jgi:probable addiction module antidote protein
VYLETAFRESCLDHNWASFGIALRSVIEAQNKDIAQIARDSGVSRQHIYCLFGKQANPTINTLVQILRALDFSIGIIPQVYGRQKAA